jgi:hypothetical protein
MGDVGSMKTTLEIPDLLFRRAKAAAARQGRPFRQLVEEALIEKLARSEGLRQREKTWMALAGALKHLHAENLRIDRAIEAEFETIEAEDRV